VEEEGPRRGFSLRGWKENLPKEGATQEPELEGQSLTYMTAIKTATLATTNKGTSHGTQFLKTDWFWNWLGCGGEPAGVFACLGCTFISTLSFPASPLPIIFFFKKKKFVEFGVFLQQKIDIVGTDGEG